VLILICTVVLNRESNVIGDEKFYFAQILDDYIKYFGKICPNFVLPPQKKKFAWGCVVFPASIALTTLLLFLSGKQSSRLSSNILILRGSKLNLISQNNYSTGQEGGLT